MLLAHRLMALPPLLAVAWTPISATAVAPHGHRTHRHHRHHRRHRIAHQPRHRRAIARDVLVAHGQPPRRSPNTAVDPGDTITDFQFSPGTLTVRLGDTVTWTNNGPSPHTATASDGSFDTGTLARGQSASHTFGQAGTFAYICKIHPFMKGTVIVQASSASPSGSGAAGGTSGTSASSGAGMSGSSGSSATVPAGSASGSSGTPAAGSTSGGSLPLTGYDVRLALVFGALMSELGLGIRGRVGKNPDSA